MNLLPLATLALAALVAATTTASAQTVSLEFAPNPAPPGAIVTLTVTDATNQGIVLPSPCGWFRIHQGSQTGPQIGLNVLCPQVLVTVPPSGSYSFPWNQQDPNGALVPPGTYWFETRVWDTAFTAIRTDWFCLSVLPPMDATLTAAGPAVLGQSTALQVSAPRTVPGAIYFLAASLDSRNPVSVLGLDTCLSLPVTGALFNNPIGALNAAGQSSGILLNVPNLPAVRNWGLQVQGLVVDAVGVRLTNALSFTLR